MLNLKIKKIYTTTVHKLFKKIFIIGWIGKFKTYIFSIEKSQKLNNRYNNVIIIIIINVFLVKGVIENFFFTKYSLNIFAEKITIKCEKELPIQVDGELLYAKDIQIEVLPSQFLFRY